MLTAIISLLPFAIPLLALPTSSSSLDKRGSTLELEIFMTETALADRTALQDLRFWQTDPGSTYPVAMTIDPSPGYTFGKGLEEATWTVEVIAEKMSVLYLEPTGQGPTNISIVRTSGDSMNCGITLYQEVKVDHLAWIIDRGVEMFFIDGKRDYPPGQDVLNITCTVV